MVRVTLTVTPKIQKGVLFGTTLYLSARAGLTGKPPTPTERFPIGVGTFMGLDRCLAVILASTLKVRSLVHASLLVPPVSWITTASGTWDKKGRLVRIYVPQDAVTVPRLTPYAYVQQWTGDDTTDYTVSENDLRFPPEQHVRQVHKAGLHRPSSLSGVPAGLPKRYSVTLLLVPLEDKQ